VSGPAFIKDYVACFGHTWDDDTTVNRVRFVVLDSETTGLDPRKDRIITIGAVGVQDGEIIVEDSFEVLLKVAYNTSAVTVHGVTREEAEAGIEEPEAMERFLEYLRDGVIVGHHIGHDVETFNVACERHWGIRMQNRSLDTMDLTLHLEADAVLPVDESIGNFSLDGLCDLFDVTPHDRHTAAGDAFITAQIFLRLLRYAGKAGRTTLGSIAEPFKPEEPSN
jgi:DNA polymerase III subunit epsilon